MQLITPCTCMHTDTLISMSSMSLTTLLFYVQCSIFLFSLTTHVPSVGFVVFRETELFEREFFNDTFVHESSEGS